MIVQVPNVLNPEQLARCREVMNRAALDRRPSDRGIPVGRGQGQPPACRRIARRRGSSAT